MADETKTVLELVPPPADESVEIVESPVTPPEVAGEAPQDPDIAGTLTPDEMGKLVALRQKGSQITVEIGNLELRKARLINSIGDIEQQGQVMLNEVAARMGLAEGTPWQVLPDGRARVLRNFPPQGPQG